MAIKKMLERPQRKCEDYRHRCAEEQKQDSGMCQNVMETDQRATSTLTDCRQSEQTLRVVENSPPLMWLKMDGI
ncbi:unnamed protein product [Toxocara canis]|uniref:Uncharacterized protein n=1 Tax=Toxocara canis TaxID=6265 RepID=A0A183U1G9_TOXCA|nr:unnamed protein product [Toxocara canis]